MQQWPVDFSSKETVVATHDLREKCVTFTREELALIVEGADLQLKSREDMFTTRLAEKDAKIARLLALAQESPASQARMERSLLHLSQDIQHLRERVHPVPTQGDAHISNLVLHPDFVLASASEATSSSQCPGCYKAFDGWSGNYTLACGHYYHLVCLIRLMQNDTKCAICAKDIPEGLYQIFGMGNDYRSKQARRTPSALRNLFNSDEAASKNHPPNQ